jgi:CCR4-NOT transcriptional regulation complex NOT5 subunit
MKTWYDYKTVPDFTKLLNHVRYESQLTIMVFFFLWHQDPDFAEDEEIYADLNLEDEEEFYAVGLEDHSHHDNEDKPKDDQDTTPKKHSKDPEPELSPAKPASAKAIPIKSKFSGTGACHSSFLDTVF